MFAAFVVPLLLADSFDQPLRSPLLDGATVSACVTTMDGKVLFELNSDRRVVPASNQKLLSAAFAFWALGESFRPQTRIWRERDRTILDTTGDPLLTYTGLRSVTQGFDRKLPVYVKAPYFVGIPASWEIDDLPSSFAAPIDAFSVDRGTFQLWSVGGKPQLRPEPFGVKLTRDPMKAKQKMIYDPLRRTLSVNGPLPAKDTLLETLSVPSAAEAASAALGQSLRITDELPSRAPDITQLGSTVAEIAAACLPPSDNNLAEHLFLLAARREGELGADPYVTARKRLSNFVNRIVQVPFGDIRPFDGSGLSRHNFVTTRAMARLLQWTNGQSFSGAWRSALVTSGKGTLASRLSNIRFKGKTGTLDSVVSLSGYLETERGSELIVSVIVNNFACSSREARTQVDLFYQNLAKTAW